MRALTTEELYEVAGEVRKVGSLDNAVSFLRVALEEGNRKQTIRRLVAGSTMLRTPGHDYGRTLQLVERHAGYLVAFCPGHGTWAGVGQGQEHCPAMFYVFRIIKEVEPDHEWVAEQVIQFPLKWRPKDEQRRRGRS